MHIQPVHCCQCGSPLRLLVAPVGATLVVCNYCSALLEVQPSGSGRITRPQPELIVIPEEELVVVPDPPDVVMAREVERIRQRIAHLDRHWALQWSAGFLTAHQARITRNTIGIIAFLAAVGGIGFELSQPNFSWTGAGAAAALISCGAGLLICSALYIYADDRDLYESARQVHLISLAEVYHLR